MTTAYSTGSSTGASAVVVRDWTIAGAAAGAVLAFAILCFGFWGFVLVLVLGLVGAIIGAAVSGRLDLGAAIAAARGRRVG